MKYKDVTSAIVGTTFFAIPYLLLSTTILPSLVIGAAAFGATELVLMGPTKEEKRRKSIPLHVRLESAKKQNKRILEIAPKIEDEKVKKQLKEINETVSKIIETVNKKPSKIKDVNNFFDYYLPVVVSIVERYDDIENQKLNSKDGKNFMSSANKMVEEANDAFKNILSRLYQSDIVDADAEMKVFNTMLKSDGIGKTDLEIAKEEENE